VVETLAIYELFHMVSRQTSWEDKDQPSRVPFRKFADDAAASEDDPEDEDDDDQQDDSTTDSSEVYVQVVL
jgi:hypothetical protein